MFITSRKARQLSVEYAMIRNVVYSIYKKIGHNTFSDFTTVTCYIIMNSNDIHELSDIIKELTYRIMSYNDEIIRAEGKIKLGKVKLPPTIII